MREQWFTAIVALAAITGLAVGGDESSTPPALLPTSLPASQAASPPLSGSAEPAAPTGDSLESKPDSDTSVALAKAVWACSLPSCFWVKEEYLLWWIKDSQLPPLVWTGLPGATALPGVLGQPGTSVLFGGGDLDNQLREGARISAGFWLNDNQINGLERSYFFLGSRSVGFDEVSSVAMGSPMIARPFFDVIHGIPNAQLVAFLGIASGEIQVSSCSRLQGAELKMLCFPCCKSCCDTCPDHSCRSGEMAKHNNYCNTCWGCNHLVNLLDGFRYLQLDESLDITEISQVNPTLAAGAPLFGGSTIAVADQFDTHSYFYGGQIGAEAEFCWGRVFVDVLGKVALGATHEVGDIQGETAITSPAGTTAVTPAGFLASESNSGHFTRDVFAVVPEAGINVGYQITRYLRAFVGYTFRYCSSLLRPGDQVDVGLGGTQIPTDTRFDPGA